MPTVTMLVTTTSAMYGFLVEGQTVEVDDATVDQWERNNIASLGGEGESASEFSSDAPEQEAPERAAPEHTAQGARAALSSVPVARRKRRSR